MTPTQQFIEDAIAGGWKLHGVFTVSNVRDKYDAGTWRFATITGETGKSFSTHIEHGELLLDPLAWQAVGKTRGWNWAYCYNCKTKVPLFQGCECDEDEVTPDAVMACTFYQLAFTRHLADGKTIDEALKLISS